MATSQGRYFQVMMDALAGFDQCENDASLRAQLADVAGVFGYRHLCFIAAPSLFPRAFDDKMLLNGWPKGWFEQYRAANFTSHDPVASFLRRQKHAFRWSDVPIPEDDRTAQSVMTISRVDYQMRQGLCVPIHGLNGYQAGISFAGSDVEDAEEAHATMQVVGIFAFNRLANIRAAAPRGKVLSPRESEVMAWTAAGKTAWDTGSILNIAEDTVNKHIASAMRKLNVHTRAQAIAESIRRGEINL